MALLVHDGALAHVRPGREESCGRLLGEPGPRSRPGDPVGPRRAGRGGLGGQRCVTARRTSTAQAPAGADDDGCRGEAGDRGAGAPAAYGAVPRRDVVAHRDVVPVAERPVQLALPVDVGAHVVVLPRWSVAPLDTERRDVRLSWATDRVRDVRPADDRRVATRVVGVGRRPARRRSGPLVGQLRGEPRCPSPPRGVRTDAGLREGEVLRLPGHQRVVLADPQRRAEGLRRRRLRRHHPDLHRRRGVSSPARR